MTFREHKDCLAIKRLKNTALLYWQTESQRYLAKQGLIVEKVGNARKLRHMFLFNDVLVCARQKISAK